jgi:ATP-dependent Lon protease
MTDKNHQKSEDILLLVERKLSFFKDLIQKTILNVQKNKSLNVLAVSDVNMCIEFCTEIRNKMKTLFECKSNTDTLINNLQIINNELSSLFKRFGSESFEDLLLICFGNSKLTSNEKDASKLELLKSYFHPINYKMIVNKGLKKKQNSDEESMDEKTKNLDCFDIMNSYKQFHVRVHGIKVYIHNNLLKKSIIVYGIMDNVVISLLDNKYVLAKETEIRDNLPDNAEFQEKEIDVFLSSLTLKDYLVHNDYNEFYNKFAGYLSQIKSMKQKSISQIIKDFIADDMFSKRITLIQLLIKSNSSENQYLAYLLYDILSNDSNGNIDTLEQTTLFDSLPLPIKSHFRHAMKNTVQYTNDLSNFDINKIPLEQQICLLKASDAIKEKAMMKLKEVKAKSEDSGSKARQYLDGLLRIPFNIYKREPILNLMETTRNQFKQLVVNYDIVKLLPNVPKKDVYTSVEILKYGKQIKDKIGGNIHDEEYVEKMKTLLTNGDKNTLVANIMKINDSITLNKLNGTSKIKYSSKKKDELKSEIELFIDSNKEILPIIDKLFLHFLNSPKSMKLSNNITKDLTCVQDNLQEISLYVKNVKTTLDKAVYGHDKAKRQIERVVAQWINSSDGGIINSGHVLGFEGNPGIGKTTLAKGLANCLKDENGISRPFSLIAIGGDSNSSSLVGHSYTYVGSTWGQIVQILIDKKCMNPIILIDEVDKISRTEHGKEITGILTHLLDPSQNESFQDKYFSGVDLDLSKALFILSYNDVNSIDKILLDRVHRIKFDNLSVEDKIVICNTHLLPEIFKTIGLQEMIQIDDETLKFIIEEYTLEPGVRKLKEKLFEIVGEINLSILKEEKDKDKDNLELPIVVTIDDIKKKYFKDKREVRVQKIHDESKIGVINALWANDLSQGGVLPLQVSFMPSNKFLELTCTGSLGEVMRESISVSLTTAWNLTSAERRRELIETFNNTKMNFVYGIHVNCPGISTKKDGPSATTAFTVAIYSLFNNLKIKNYFGITGETSFDCKLTEIGGLREKIIHSIPAGIKEFIYPVENEKDFQQIMDKYKGNDILKGITFHAVDTIEDVFDLILEK